MASDVKTVQGVVEATAQNAPDRYGLRIGHEWYDGFGPCPAERGDAVEVAYSEKGKFRDVEKVRRAEPKPAVLDFERLDAVRERQIARAVALKCAAQLYAEGWATSAEVVTLAEKFETWLLRASQ